MESFATPYPVMFYDGEREHDKGQIGVHSVLTNKRFQALLSQKIGLPANQLSAVFVCRRTAKDTDKRQKLPINDNTNFNIILNQHNPIWEKDCHFLVSVKKSKKERKGSRRRSAETENGDDDDSVSPRGELSPQDERPKSKVSVDDGAAREELQSQTNMMGPGPSLPGSPQSENPLDQRLNTTASPNGKEGSEKVLLRREQTSPDSPRQNGSQVDKHVDMISTGSPPMESSSRQGSSSHQADVQNTDEALGQIERNDGRPINRTDQKVVIGQPSPLQMAVLQNSGPLQERYNEAVPVRSPVLLQRNGILNVAGTVVSDPSFPHVSASRPLAYPMPTGMLLSRVPSGISGLVSGNSASLNLQQAQAHYLNLQSQHSEQIHLTPQALSKMRGAVRGLAAYENENPKGSGVCRHCCTFRERNIRPTPFHLCVHDRVTNGFRGPSPAGPIERPAKRLEAAA